ncbi:retention module-containing protein [Thiomicrorhabdus sp. zzn3]|uniref:retention module-containing protein n=1 Tax=Thiomicrorhabdus sp. zzn3 TaxID=3039775 RepID=UPI0024369C3F|nr:retention module-containing protein [Thiomicrorhabdus sp. zzn3]MDG6778850.1 retention module-containing protein [Thiomicrorhabdus sp. zzn3]
MSMVAGKVTAVSGVVQAVNPSTGEVRLLVTGDQVFQDEMIVTAVTGGVTIDMENGEVLTLGRNTEMTLDEDVVGIASNTNPTTDAAMDAEALQQAILAGEIDLEDLEATAAGESNTSSANAGALDSVERLGSTGEVTSGFDTSATATDFTTRDFQTATAPENTEPTPPTEVTPQNLAVIGLTGDATVIEGESASYTINLTDENGAPLVASEDLTVDLTYTFISAEGEDIQQTTTVTVPAGSSAVEFNVATIDDVLAEGAEDFAVSINSVVSGGGQFDSISIDDAPVTTTILDDSNPGTEEPDQETALVSISGAQDIVEGETSTAYTVSVDQPASDVTSDITVQLSYSGVAEDGTDFEGVAEVTIPAGSNSTTFTIDTIDDALAEGSESFTITIGDITDTNFENIAADSTADSVVSTINDQTGTDEPPTPVDTVYAVLSGDATVVEGETASYTVSLVDKDGQPVTLTEGQSYTVDLSTNGTGLTLAATEGTDYVSLDGDTLTITGTADGVSSADFTVSTTDDYVADNGEQYNVEISNASSAAFENAEVQTGSVTTTITDLDTVPTIGNSAIAVSEEGLDDGIADDEAGTGYIDTTNDTVVSGSLAITGNGTASLEVGIDLNSLPTDLSSGGDAISWSYDSGNEAVAIGSTTDGEAIRVELNGGNSSVNTSGSTPPSSISYTVALTQPLDHEFNSLEDVLSFDFDVSVNDGANPVDTGTITVSVEDDMPELGSFAELTLDNQDGEFSTASNAGFLSGADGWDDISLTGPELEGVTYTSSSEVIDGVTYTVLTANDGTDDVFTIKLGENGDYRFEILKSDAGSVETTVDFAQVVAGGPTSGYDFGDVTATPSGTNADLNPSTTGLAGDGNSLQVGEAITFTFDSVQSGVDEVIFGLKAPQGGTFNYEFYDGTTSVSSGSVSTDVADGDLLLYAPASFTSVELTVVESPAALKITSMETIDLITAPGQDLEFGVNATDADGDSVSGSINVSINPIEPESVQEVDPAPISVGETQVMDFEAAGSDSSPITTNVVITLDLSGSMTENNDGPNGSDIDRLALAKDALTNMINSYDDMGSVNVKLVTFSSSGTVATNADGEVWMTAQEAIDIIDDLQSDGSTNYEDAVYETYHNYSEPAADQTVAYFISDGEPTSENDDGGSGKRKEGDDGEAGWLDSSYQAGWNNFVADYVDQLNVVALGEGITNTSYLEILADAGGDVSDVIVVRDETQLEAELTPTDVTLTVNGDLTDNITYEGDTPISFDSITVGATTYTAADFANGQTVALDGDGELSVDFANGTYTYTASESEFDADTAKVFTVTASDVDGDETQFDVTININVPENLLPESESEIQTMDFETAVLESVTTNVVITLDLSGSMTENNDGPNGSDIDRLALAKDALTNMINSYDDMGSVNVKLVTFSSSGTVATNADGEVWMTAQEAIDIIDDLQSDGSTNYEDAVYETYHNYSEPAADQTVAYFISDGEPTTDQWGDGDYNYLSNWAQTGWNNFVADYVDQLNVVALGEGITDTSYLETLANAGGDVSDVIVVRDETQLDASLTPDITLTVNGSFADNITNEGDGSITFDSITVGAATYTAADFANGQTVALEGDGELSVDFANGTYSYTASQTEFTGDATKSFTVTASDVDGDETQFDVNININLPDSNDIIMGHGGNDILYGYGGDDSLDGGAGDDLLYGGLGDDILTGGDGADHFMIEPGNPGDVTTITDYDKAQGDVLDLSEVLKDTSVDENSLDQYLQFEGVDTDNDGTDDSTKLTVFKDDSKDTNNVETIILENNDAQTIDDLNIDYQHD